MATAINVNTDAMQLSFQGGFDFEESPGSPRIPIGETGLIAHASELGVERAGVSFTLACTYKLDEATVRRFSDVTHALTLIVEDPVGGRVALTRLEDPTLLYEPMPSPRFDAARGAGGSRDVLLGGTLRAIIEVSGFARRRPPTLYARVALHALVSPTLELAFADRTVKTAGGA